MLERIVLTVIPHPAALTAAQLLLFSLVLCAFLMMGYDRGMPLPLLYRMLREAGALPEAGA